MPADIAAIRDRVARSRAEQGLPPVITDSGVLARIAEVFALIDAPATPTGSAREHLPCAA